MINEKAYKQDIATFRNKPQLMLEYVQQAIKSMGEQPAKSLAILDNIIKELKITVKGHYQSSFDLP